MIIRKRRGLKTRFEDRNGEPIYVGDILHIEEYPGKYVGGSLDFEGIVTEEYNDYLKKWEICVTYCDIGESESFPLNIFKRHQREILTEEQTRAWYKTMHLGEEPPEELWKREIYRNDIERWVVRDNGQ